MNNLDNFTYRTTNFINTDNLNVFLCFSLGRKKKMTRARVKKHVARARLNI